MCVCVRECACMCNRIESELHKVCNVIMVLPAQVVNKI